MVIGIGNGPDMRKQREIVFAYHVQILIQLHDAAGITGTGAALCNVQMAVAVVVANAVSMIKGEITDLFHQLSGGKVIFVQDGFIMGQIAVVISLVINGSSGNQVGGSVFFIDTGALCALEFIVGVLRKAGIYGDHSLGIGVAGVQVPDQIQIAVEPSGIGVDPAAEQMSGIGVEVAKKAGRLVINAVGIRHLAERRTVRGIVDDVHLGLPESIQCHTLGILGEHGLILVLAGGSEGTRHPAAKDIAVAREGAGRQLVLSHLQKDRLHGAGSPVGMEGHGIGNRMDGHGNGRGHTLRSGCAGRSIE